MQTFALTMQFAVDAVMRPRSLSNYHCGLVTPNGDKNLGQHWPRYGLLPDGTKPLPEPMLTYHQRFRGLHLRAISQGVRLKLFPYVYSDITLGKITSSRNSEVIFSTRLLTYPTINALMPIGYSNDQT